MDFRELNKKLNGRCDPMVQAVIGELYLMFVELQKQNNKTISMMEQMVNSLGGLAILNEATMQEVRKLARGGIEEGVSVESVPLTGEDNG